MVKRRMMEDREIVRRIVEDGERELFGELVRRYSPQVFSKAVGVVRDREAAAELTQQTFVRAYTRLGDWRGEDSIAPWLVIIALHLALNYSDSRQRRRKIPDDPPAEDDFSEEREERLQLLEHHLGRLPDEDRRLIEGHYFARKKTGELAREMGLTQSNVLVRLHRIREKLKKQMTDETIE